MIDTVAMKRRVLELAMTGKLSSYEDGDDKVESVINNISIEKEMLLKQRNGRADNNLKDRSELENDELPINWAWIRFGETGLFKKGPFGSALTKAMFVPKGTDTVKVYEQQHAINKKHQLGTYYITRQYFEENMKGFEVKPGDIIVSCAGTIGETYIMPDDIEQGIINQALMRVTLIPSIYEKFFLYYFEYGLKKTAQAESNGSAIKNIPPFDVMKNWPFPITSVQEQKRIVEKIEGLFLQIDKISILQREYTSNLEILKSKIIDAGIQGKLTEQLSEDGIVDYFYDETILDKDKSFNIPDNWRWIRLGWAMEIERGGSPRPIKAYITEDENGVNWIKIGDVEKDGKYIYSTKEKIKPEGEKKSRKVYPGDFLLTNSMSFGRPYISKIEGCIHDGWLLLRNSKNIFDLDYLYWLLSSKYAYNQFAKKASGATVDNLNKEKVASAIIPLPPLAEQRRIANRIEEIIKLL